MKHRVFDKGVLVSEEDLPDMPAFPQSFDKDQFEKWFAKTFGADATPTLKEISEAWPVQ